MNIRKNFIIGIATAVQLLCLTFAAAAAGAKEETKGKEALVRDMLDAMQIERTMDQTMSQMQEMLKQQAMEMSRQMVDLENIPEEHASILFDEIMPEYMDAVMKLYLDRLDYEALLNDIFIPVYSKYLDEEDIVALTEFYRSRAGKKLVEATPAITMESMQRMMEIIVSPELMDEMKALNGQLEKRIEEELK